VADTVLTVEVRSGTGKGVGRKLRAAGRIPGVIYGRGRASVPVSLDARELERLLAGGGAGMNTLLDLRVVGGKPGPASVVLVKELQRDPALGSPVHADLYVVDLTQTVEVNVPIHLIGRPRGVEMGGILDQTLREISIECLPRDIPPHVECDVSELDIGDVRHVRDLILPEGVKLRSDPELGVVHVIVPAAEEAAPVEEAAAAPAEVEAVAEQPTEEKGE
jgi:large subunit ribosomal protein L25